MINKREPVCFDGYLEFYVDMSILRKFISTNVNQFMNYPNVIRPISIFSSLCLKEIKTVKEGNNIVISGSYVESPRVPFLVKNTCVDSCILCQLKLDIKHTDVLILNQFLRSDGCMLPRRITKLCRKQQRKMSTLVTMAQKAGLMPNLNPANSNKDPKKRFGWKKYNKYFYDV